MPASALPEITEAVTIDGYSQPSSSPNNSAVGTNANIVVELFGSSQPPGNGLVLAGTGGSTVKGLAIYGFGDTSNGNGSAILLKSGGNKVTGNFLGVDNNGSPIGNAGAGVTVGEFSQTAPLYAGNIIGGILPAERNLMTANKYGVALDEQAQSTSILGNLIGTDAMGNAAQGSFGGGIFDFHSTGTSVGDGSVAGRNVIAGNITGGISTDGSTGISIRNNYIGINADGSAALGNLGFGIAAIGGATGGLIEQNVVSGNSAGGIRIGETDGGGHAQNFNVRNNLIGTNPTGMVGIPNNGAGVLIESGSFGNVIGGTAGGQGNVIAFNADAGIDAQESGNDNRFYGNSIHSNGGLGINQGGKSQNAFGVTPNDSPDADGVTNWPQLQTFNNTGVAITLNGVLNAQSNRMYRVEFFVMAPNQIDQSGYGEGAVFLGFQDVTTNGTGVATLSYSQTILLPGDSAFSATVTPLVGGSTSEFGPTVGTAINYTWKGGVVFDWFNPANWTPVGVPGPLDKATISTGTIDLLTSVSVKQLVLTGGTLTGSTGEISVLGSFTWSGGNHANGTLRLVEGSTAIIGGAAMLFWNNGTLENRGSLTVNGSGLNFNQGTFVNSTDGIITLQAGVDDSNGSATATSFFNDGKLLKQGTGAFGVTGMNISNIGTIRSQAGVFVVGGITQTSGLTELAGGGFSTVDPIQINAGVLAGEGDITGAVVNSGTIYVGGKEVAGTLSISGDFTQFGGGKVIVDLGGLTAGSQYDQLTVTGLAALSGTLEQKLLGTFVVRVGDDFTVLTGGPVDGTFINVVGVIPASYSLADVKLEANGIVVTNTNDSGTGSLREAITLANANFGLDFISFAISAGGVQTITPLTALPDITDDIVIDGYTQIGAQVNTLAVGSNAALRIELSGASVTGAQHGLNVSAGTATISGLIINRWGGYGVAVGIFGGGSNVLGNWIGPDSTGNAAPAQNQGGVLVEASSVTIGSAAARDRNVISGNPNQGINVLDGSASGTTIRGNYIGTNPAGNGMLGNSNTGITTVGPNTVIGGDQPGQGNVISATQGLGIFVSGGTAVGTVVYGNFIGTDATGMQDFGNTLDGIRISAAPNIFIGSSAPGARNIIAGNGGAGINIISALATTIHGNFIGSNVTGTAGIANAVGISIDAGTGSLIGDVDTSHQNIIAYNTGHGIAISAGGGTATANTIRGNSIHSNGGLGINLIPTADLGNGVTPNDALDADSGANTLLNYPTLSSYSGGQTPTVSGTYSGAANKTYFLDFYGSPSGDPSGNGEGRFYMMTFTVTTNASGDTTFTAPIGGAVPDGGVLTATATELASGNTSEFSNVLATVIATTRTWDAGGGANTNWSNPQNWSGDVVPNPVDTAQLLSNFTITLDVPVNIANFTQTDGTVTGGGIMTITNGLTWSKGTQSGPSSLVIAPGATATLSSGNVKTLDRRFLDNQGTVIITGAGNLSLLNGPSITNSGVWDFQSDADIDQTDTTGSMFTNAGGGVLRKSAGAVAGGTLVGRTNPNLAFINDGTIDALNGTLTFFSSGGTWAGSSSLIVSAGATLGFTGGNFIWNTAPAITGSGTLDISLAANIALGADTSIPVGFTFAMSGGTLSGAGDLIVSGHLTFAGGIMTGAGTTAITPSGTMSVETTSVKTLDGRQLNNEGAVTHSGGNLRMMSAANVSNFGIWDLDGDVNIASTAPGPNVFTIQPGGILRKTAGIGISEVGVLLNHAETSGNLNDVAVQTGTLRLLGGGVWDDTDLNISTGATLELAGGTFRITNQQVYASGAGTVWLSGGTLDLVSDRLVTDAATTFEFSGGTLSNQSDHDAVINGPATWSGGNVLAASTTSGIGFYGNLTISGAANRSVFGQISDFSGGTSTLSMSGNIDLVDDSGFTNYGTMTITGSGAFTHSGTVSGAFFASVGNGTTTGILSKNGTTTMTFGAGVEFSASGLLLLSGGTLSLTEPSQLLGMTNLQGGTISATGMITLSSSVSPGNEGVLSGVGALIGDLLNTNGMVRPGGNGSIGTITLLGDYTQGSTGALDIEIMGTGAGQFDVLNATGDVALDGLLNVSYLSAFQPSVGDFFNVLTSSTLSGTFAGNPGEPLLTTDYAPSGVKLERNAITYIWDNTAADGDWFNPLNWNLDSGTPGAADTVIINIATTINLPSSVSISVLEQSNGTLGGAGALAVADALTWSGGNIELPITTGSVSNNTLGGSVPMTLDSALLSLGGNTNFGGILDIGITGSNAELRNTGAFNFLSNAGISGTGTFHNFAGSGGVTKTSSAQVSIGVAFLNGEALTVGDGILSLEGGGNWLSNTSATLGSAAFLNFTGGTHTFGGSNEFNGAGITRLDGATVEFNGNGATVNAGHTFQQLSGALGGTGDFTVVGIFQWSGGTQVGPGETIIVSSNDVAIINGSDTKTLDLRVLNVSTGSALVVDGGGSVSFANGAEISVSGSFTFTSGATMSDAGGAASSIRVQPGGSLNKVDSADTFIEVPFANGGLLTFSNGAVSFLDTFTQISGTTILGDGDVSFAIPAEFQGGILSGAGMITGDINNTGAIIRPGSSPGEITITGDYTQGVGGTLDIEINGLIVGEDFDRLIVSGNVSLDGTLIAALGFTPSPGDTFAIITGASFSGDFATTTIPSDLSTLEGATSFSLRVPFLPPGVVRLANLDGTNGFVITPGSPADLLGVSVTGLGDINGDNKGDFAIGSSNVNSLAGAIYVVFGTDAGFGATFDLTTLDGTNGFVIHGEASGDLVGVSVRSAGDLNKDGVLDIIVGASGNDTGGADSGAAYVIFGKRTAFGPTISLSVLDGTNGFKLTGIAAGDRTGFSVNGAGDLNNDGNADIIIGVPEANGSGAAYVVFGGQSGNVDISALDGTTGFTITGASTSDRLGFSVAGGGDINGDGVSDFIVGAPGSNVFIPLGAAYVFFGRKDGIYSAAIDVTSLDGKTGFKIEGVEPNEGLGVSVAFAGDMNGDGLSEILIGAVNGYAFGETIRTPKSSNAYVIFGKAKGYTAALELSTINGTDGLCLRTGSSVGHGGVQVSGIGDFNGDGLADILIGAPDESNGTGAAYLMYGRTAGYLSELSLTTLNGTNGLQFLGITSSGAGASVGGGDVNGDGAADLIIGSPYANNVHIILGSVDGQDVPVSSKNGTTLTFSDEDDDIIVLKVTGGKITADMLTIGPDEGLQLLDLTKGSFKEGTNITFSVKKGATGDGIINVGTIDATGIKLGNVKISGDLGQIKAGDGSVSKPNVYKNALKSLTVGSFGAKDGSTQLPGTEDPLVSEINGSLPKFIIKGTFKNATFNVIGKLGTVTIGGDLTGQGAFDSAQLAALTALGYYNIASVSGGTTLASSGISAGSINKLSVKGALSGSAVKSSGNIGSASVGSMNKGAIAAAGSLKVVKVLAEIIGDATTPSVISALPVGKSPTAINKLTVKGNVTHAEILIGYDTTFVPVNGDAGIGNVSIGGNFTASSLVAGIQENPGDADARFGEDDIHIPGFDSTDPLKADKILSKIASLTIKGSVEGTPGIAGDSYGITAQKIGKVKINGVKVILDKLLPDDIGFGTDDDVRLVEVI